MWIPYSRAVASASIVDPTRTDRTRYAVFLTATPPTSAPPRLCPPGGHRPARGLTRVLPCHRRCGRPSRSRQNRPRCFSLVFHTCRNTIPDWSTEMTPGFLREIEENDPSRRSGKLPKSTRMALLRPRTAWRGDDAVSARTTCLPPIRPSARRVPPVGAWFPQRQGRMLAVPPETPEPAQQHPTGPGLPTGRQDQGGLPRVGHGQPGQDVQPSCRGERHATSVTAG